MGDILAKTEQEKIDAIIKRTEFEVKQEGLTASQIELIWTKATLAINNIQEQAREERNQKRLMELQTAFETINKSGSYDYWVTRSYILLGDIYFKQKDYFNAKATYQSIVDNTLNPELKNEAQAKLTQVIDEEGKSSKVNN